MPRPIAIDLFAGAGGLSLGFEQAGFDVVCSVEHDPVHCATHKFNFPETRVLCADVADVTGAQLRAEAGLAPERTVDCLFGGPPCQGFSFIGKRLVDDPRNALLGHFIRIAGELEPRYVVMENVPGIASGGHRGILDEAIRELESFGYSVVSPSRILDASQYGVPQKRRRFFLIAHAQGENPPNYPNPQAGAKTVTVWDAIGDLPSPECYASLTESDVAETAVLSEPTSSYAARLRGLESDPDDYSYSRSPVTRGLTSSMRTTHTEVSIGRFRATSPGTVEPVSRFLKLDPTGQCNTLRAGTAADRGAYTSPRPIHPVEPRCITVREAARLHSYPDWFRFHATKWHGFRQVGNSVPPLLARAVAGQVLEAAGFKPSRPPRTIQLGDEALLRWNPSQAAAAMGVVPLPSRNRQQ